MLELANLTFVIVNVYGFDSHTENNDLIGRLEELVLRWLTKLPESHIISGADFNAVLNNCLDRWPPKSSD